MMARVGGEAPGLEDAGDAAYVALGRSSHEIAEALQLSPLTAKTHVSRILYELDARDRVQLVVMAYRRLVASA